VSKDTSQRPPRSRACVPRNGTYHSVKSDLLLCQKRPIIVSKDSSEWS
jgi:hypothetical protein